MPLDRLTSRLNTLLPQTCFVVTGKISSFQFALHNEEHDVSTKAFGKARSREFIGGRNAAKLAANTLGFPSIRIGRNPRGYPEWPSGVVGSISHKNEWCGALVSLSIGHKSVGYDIEIMEPLRREVWSVFAKENEIAQCDSCGIEESIFANLLFASKEAFFKCIYPHVLETTPSISSLNVRVRKSTDYLETELTHNNHTFSGGILFNDRFVTAWSALGHE